MKNSFATYLKSFALRITQWRTWRVGHIFQNLEKSFWNCEKSFGDMFYMISRLRATNSKSYFEVLLLSRKKQFFVMGAEKSRFFDMEPIWVILEKTCFCALKYQSTRGFFKRVLGSKNANFAVLNGSVAPPRNFRSLQDLNRTIMGYGGRRP